jgi:hypothetical protein
MKVNQFNKEEYNKMCAEFLGFTEHIPDEKRREWNNACYPDLPYYRLEYNVPIQFGYDYVTPTVLHVLYNNADKIPRLTEKIAVAKMKFHSDWNWIMEVVDTIPQKVQGINLSIHPNSCLITDTGVRGQYSLNASKNIVKVLDAPTRKEAVIQAIWEFLNWYNKQTK